MFILLILIFIKAVCTLLRREYRVTQRIDRFSPNEVSVFDRTDDLSKVSGHDCAQSAAGAQAIGSPVNG